MINYIEIDGVKSGVYGLFFKRLPVWPTATEGVDAYTIPGRAENLHRKNGKYNDITVTLEAVAIGLNTDKAKNWMASGKKLFLSTMPDRYGIIKQLTEYTETRLGTGALEIKATFTCSPFKYSVEEDIGDYIYIDTNPYSLQVGGTMYAEPELRLFEISAGATLTINGVKITFDTAQDNAIIDVKTRVIYTENYQGEKTVIQANTRGRFWDMVLIPSATDYNLISYTGINHAYILPRARWC